MRENYKGRIFTVEADHNVEGPGPHTFFIEDWWDDLTGGSWMFAEGNPACIVYAIRGSQAGLPLDNEVLYGHIGSPGGLGMLVHEIELGEEVMSHA